MVHRRSFLISSLLFSGLQACSGASDLNFGRKRLALVIGNADYEDAEGSWSSLLTPVNDAEKFSDRLRALNFDVLQFTDLNQNEMMDALNDFGRRIDEDQNIDALIYFAGHGYRFKKHREWLNYFVPVSGGEYEETGTKMVSLNDFLCTIAKAKHARIIFIDACRSDGGLEEQGFSTNDTEARGGPKVGDEIAPCPNPDIDDVFIGYAASSGRQANDTTKDEENWHEEKWAENSPFTQALIENLGKHRELTHLDDYKKIRDRVQTLTRETNNLQKPDFFDGLSKTFYFAPRSSMV